MTRHDELLPHELIDSGRLSKTDAAMLRRISGEQTFAEWVTDRLAARVAELTVAELRPVGIVQARPPARPYRVTDRRLLLACGVVAQAYVHARFMARHAPTALIARVVQRELDPAAFGVEP